MEFIPVQSKFASNMKVIPISSPPMRMKQKKSFKIPGHSAIAAASNRIWNTNYDENKKMKAVFVIGTTATGKSKLSIDLATHFQGEIINSDKIQVYKGLDILTNKVSEAERQVVPHHLLGFVEPDEDFTIQDFCYHVHMSMNHIIGNGRLPIIAGGSNNYIRTLVEDPFFNFKANYDACFLWVDVALPVLFDRASKRVDEMVDAGLVDEVRDLLVPGIDHNCGIWRAIGVKELDSYVQAEKEMVNNEITKKILLDAAIHQIKENTNKLITTQLMKIRRLRNDCGWKLHRLDATSVHERSGRAAKDAWDREILRPSFEIVADFLKEDHVKAAKLEAAKVIQYACSRV